jgi:hypothetical protein
MVTYASQTKWCRSILVDWWVGITDSHVDVEANDRNAQKCPCDEPVHAFQGYQILPMYALDVKVCNGNKW